MTHSTAPRDRRVDLHRRRYSLWRLIRANVYHLFTLLRDSFAGLAGFLVVVLAGASYFRFVYPAHLPFFVALYETLKLLVFQSGRDLPGDALGTSLFFLVPILGLAFIVQSMLTFSRRLLDKRSQLDAWQVALASTYSGHVIVCGLGRVGLRVVTRLLESGYEPVVIERDWSAELVERALRFKVPVVQGDARDPQTLRRAGVQRAVAVMAVINGDMLNIEIALAARELRPTIRVILRAFSEDLDHDLERAFGRNSAFSASALAEPTFTASAISRDLSHALPLGDGPELLGVAQLVVNKGSPLTRTAREVEETHGVRLLLTGEGKRAKRSAYVRIIQAGETLLALGPLAALESFRQANATVGGDGNSGELLPRHPTRTYDTVIVCGAGKVGYRMVRRLDQFRPRPRIVLVHNGDSTEPLLHAIEAMDNVSVVSGDPREAETLRAAGIDRAYSVAAVTPDDQTNLHIGLTARGLRPDAHVVLRVFSDALAEKLADLFGIHTTYSTSDLASPTLAAAAILGGVDHAFYVAGRLFAVDQMRAVVTSWIGKSLAAVRDNDDIMVVALQRGGERLFFPPLAMTIEKGDELTVLAPLHTLTHAARERE